MLFRSEPILAPATVRTDGATYLALPDDVDVESVLVQIDGVAVRRGVDVETAQDPDTGRYTLRLLSAEARIAAKKARDGRNLALALGLVAFVVLVFVVTLVRLGGNVAHPHV